MSFPDTDMAIMDEMRFMEGFLRDEASRGSSMEKYYEMAQYAGNIVPRL